MTSSHVSSAIVSSTASDVPAFDLDAYDKLNMLHSDATDADAMDTAADAQGSPP